MPSIHRRPRRVVATCPALSSTHHRPRILALAVAGLILGMLAVAGATSAQAHNALRSTDPADGSTVAVAPDHVTLAFDEPGLALGTQVEVRSADGTVVSTGDPLLVDATVTQTLVDARPAGVYTVAWRVTSADGHPITGQLSFTATSGTPTVETPTPSETPSASPSSSPTETPVATPDETTDEAPDDQTSAPVIVVVVVAAAVISWLLWRRRRPRGGPDDE